MSDYPILLRLEDRLCLVVGGGPVGLRKVRGLLAAGARVRLVDAEGSGVEDPGVETVARSFRADEDLTGVAIAFACTSDRQTNRAVAGAARRAGVPVGIADRPDEGDFALPALLRRGELTVAVSTSGGSPALAALVRDRLAEVLGPEWEIVTELAAALRRRHLTCQGKTNYSSRVLDRLLESNLLSLVAEGRSEAVDRHLKALFGEGVSLASLGIRLSKETT